jgi:hypothetical protein
MKTSSLHESETIESTHVAALLEFLPVFGAPGFCPGGEIPVDEEGYQDEGFVKLVSKFMDACYKNGFIVKFNWEAWEAEAAGYQSEPARLQSADLPLLRRLLTWHVRQNRFAKGHLSIMIAQGHILAILRRLKDIAASSPA